MMSIEVAKKLGLKLEPYNCAVMYANGHMETLVGITPVIDFYIAGISGQDWLMYVKAEAIFVNGLQYFVRNKKGIIMLSHREVEEDEDETEDEEDNDHLLPVYDDEFDEDQEASPAFQVRMVDLGVQEVTITTPSSCMKVGSAPNPTLGPTTMLEETPDPFVVDNVEVDINPALTKEQCQELVDLLEKHRDRLTMKMEDLEVTTLLQHEVKLLPDTKPVYVGWSP
ncbi:hypothetical protein BGZ76_003626 [Entomortierella beljakovae]|nr:hypothetical protein BGZ76_003626 [Entomortierella beljakovae]